MTLYTENNCFPCNHYNDTTKEKRVVISVIVKKQLFATSNPKKDILKKDSIFYIVLFGYSLRIWNF